MLNRMGRRKGRSPWPEELERKDCAGSIGMFCSPNSCNYMMSCKSQMLLKIIANHSSPGLEAKMKTCTFQAPGSQGKK